MEGILILIISMAVALLSILYAMFHYSSLLKKNAGSPKMRELSDIIHNGAMTFLNKQYRSLLFFMVPLSFALLIFLGWKVSLAFVFGAIFSVLAGNISMRAATKANARTAQAAKKNLGEGLQVAFLGGSVAGFATVGLGLSGVVLTYLLFRDVNVIYGFGLGASLSALFARVAGGIFTKAADIGADLVGKVEKGIPEDDARNPAVIADNVGDNVGDIAGMGADLFESYVDSILAAMVLGLVTIGEKGLFLPFLMCIAGIFSSLIGSRFVHVKKRKLYSALDKGTFVSAAIMAVLSFFIIRQYLNKTNLFFSAVVGLLAGVFIGYSVEYLTSPKKKPTQSVAKASKAGPAITIIKGVSVGMNSIAAPVLVISVAVLAAYHFGQLYGIAISAVGMLSIVAIPLALDSYGPIADNAAGIAEMAKLGRRVRRRAELLDEVGNSTAAASRGLQLGASALTVMALFASFLEITKLEVINLGESKVIIGLFFGGLLPFVFSSLIISSVGEAAFQMIKEVRRQFRSNKKILTGKAKPNYTRCISISTDTAIKKMFFPGVLAIISPLIIGLLFGLETLGGFLIGTIVVGVMLSLFLSNTGTIWDNAKKYIEEGHLGGKGSQAHKASVIGDTVGDPFKDAAGPSLDILIKLVTISATVFLPIVIKYGL